jgi:hypothetical protein
LAKAPSSDDLGWQVTALCKAVDIPRWKYQDWEEAHYVARGGPGATEADAVETAVVWLLTKEELDRDDIVGIIASVRAEVRQLASKGDVGRARLVCNLRSAKGILVYGDDDEGVGQAIAASTPFRSIELFPKVSEVRGDFQYRVGLPRPAAKKKKKKAKKV